jgi:choline kinase
MKAIILAAGIGERIGNYTDDPKCLLDLRGETLMERYLKCFEELGIKDVGIVVGYKNDLIKQKLESIFFTGSIRLITNTEYSKGSILSLWAAREELKHDILLMDGDVFFEKEVLRRLVESKHPNCLIMDTTSPNTGEECMMAIRGGKVYTMERGLQGDCDLLGEWVGFLKMEKDAAVILCQIADAYVQKGDFDIGYEEILPELFKEVDFRFELVDGLKWVEIDFAEDIEKANYLVGKSGGW